MIEDGLSQNAATRLALRRVIEHDSPALRTLSQKERELPVRLVAGPLQTPAPEHDRSIVTEWRDRQTRKSQHPHLLPFVVFLRVTITHRLPSMGDLVTRDKGRLRRASVPLHEAVNVTAVPGGDLRFEDATYRSF